MYSIDIISLHHFNESLSMQFSNAFRISQSEQQSKCELIGGPATNQIEDLIFCLSDSTMIIVICLCLSVSR